ncbi:hypothetical protein C8Q75DRAFT_787635 [Abortiporus biennis]|nr:hypothetical protein C8Q75DRAFT_787635 [Abortiporus biennis]
MPPKTTAISTASHRRKTTSPSSSVKSEITGRPAVTAQTMIALSRKKNSRNMATPVILPPFPPTDHSVRSSTLTSRWKR